MLSAYFTTIRRGCICQEGTAAKCLDKETFPSLIKKLFKCGEASLVCMQQLDFNMMAFSHQIKTT